MLLLGVAIVVASIPAWTGGFVYDDLLMRNHEAMNGVEDLWLAFRRTSYDYFRVGADNAVTGATYRPLGHVTLIGIQVAFGSSPLANHLASLALHLVCVFCFFAALVRRCSWTLAFAVIAVFGLHPIAVESYGWINGRADLLGGVFLSALALVFAHEGSKKPPAFLAASACAAGAVLSKETSSIALLALAGAEMLPCRAPVSFVIDRRKIPAVTGTVVGVGIALAVRVLLVGMTHAGGVALRAQTGTLEKLVILYADALSSFAIPLPRTMATLAWELWQPIDPKQWALVVLAGSGVSVVAARGALRSAALLAGAAATLAPTVLVSSAFWCGFDRYLYMPLILCGLAVAESPWAETPGNREMRWLRHVTAVVALLLAASTYATAKNYRSQSAFIASMIQLRPEDPSGYIIGAEWLTTAGRKQEGAKMLETVPRRGLPRPLASALVTRLAKTGQRDDAILVLEDMAVRYPDDPYTIYEVVITSVQRNDLSRAFAAADRLRGVAGFCTGVQAVLANAEGRPGIDTTRVASFLRGYACQ